MFSGCLFSSKRASLLPGGGEEGGRIWGRMQAAKVWPPPGINLLQQLADFFFFFSRRAVNASSVVTLKTAAVKHREYFNDTLIQIRRVQVHVI